MKMILVICLGALCVAAALLKGEIWLALSVPFSFAGLVAVVRSFRS